MTTSIGMVVVTRDRRAELLATLDHLRETFRGRGSRASAATGEAARELPALVVVDNGSSDGTARAVGAAHPWCQVIELQENRGAAGRTIGVRALGTDLVAFADDDSWWPPDSLDRAVELFDTYPGMGLLAAEVRLEPSGERDQVCALMARSTYGSPPGVDLPGPAVLGFVACGAVVRRTSYLEVGGFHPRFGIGGEETLLALDLAAAGWGCAYVDAVVAHHRPSPSRDPARRAAVVARNALWTDMLRRPFDVVAAHAHRLAERATTDEAAARGLAWAIDGAPDLWGERRPLPQWLEHQLP
jgi:GT2 family glycosyltransferase